VIVNADQTFLRFYPEHEYVLAPTGCKRVGGKIRSDEKSGCTLMVTAELNSSKLLPPFLVLNGRKKVNAKNLQQTLWWKYQDWSSRPGHSATLTFQEKHWFDEDITIEYLEYLLEYYTGLRLVWFGTLVLLTALQKSWHFLKETKIGLLLLALRVD
jgi:hypothetical protein